MMAVVDMKDKFMTCDRERKKKERFFAYI